MKKSDNGWKQGLIGILLACIVCSCCVTGADETRTVTDMMGRTVTVPGEIHSVLGTSPPVTVTMYMIAPDLLMGVNSAFNQTKFIPDTYTSLPYVGGQQTTGTLNYETYLGMNPDIVLYFYPGKADLENTENMQTHLNPIPVLGVTDAHNASNYIPEIEYLGTLLNKKEQADELIRFYRDVYQRVTSKVAAIPEDQKARVYYAEGKDGLNTDPANSFHAQIINVCGGKNVATGLQTGVSGMTQVSVEQVAAWNPEIIITAEKQYYDSVATNPAWKDISAVKENRVYLVPGQPFGWFDRPPGVNTIIGIPWTAKALYPDLFSDLDLKSLTKEFYSKFYHYDLTDNEADKILSDSGLTT